MIAALVDASDRVTREVEFNARLHAFAKHWGFRPRACAPYRARTKGKDERGVGYVKKNAIAGRQFESWSALEAHLDGWTREIADQRVHGTTGEAPIERFRRAEAGALEADRRHSAVCSWRASWCARSRLIASSRSTATPIRCRGG